LAKASTGTDATEMYRYWVGWVHRQFQSVAALSLDEIVSLLSSVAALSLDEIVSLLSSVAALSLDEIVSLLS